MRPVSRRRALQLYLLGAASATVGAVGLSWPGSRLTPATGAPLVQPRTWSSAGGGLRVRLEAAQGAMTVAGRAANALGYNGGLPGPTLRLRPGDRLQVSLVNHLDVATNLHVHGLHVSPEGNGDNIFVSVAPGQTFDYDYRLPPGHPPGVFWYHPHHHPDVAAQVFGGLYGAIVVDDPHPIPVARERVLVISDITLDASGRLQQPSGMAARMTGREGELVLVNGQVRPVLQARPGERERWRVVNACAARYLRLRLDGQQVQLLGLDSGRFESPRTVGEVVLAAGNRADLLVTTAAGTSVLEGLSVDRGTGAGIFGAGSAPPGPLATLQVTGVRSGPPPAVPAQPVPRDLRAASPVARRRVTFGMGGGMGGGGMQFVIDGKSFDPQRVDQTVTLDTVEEWTIANTSPMDHPMHLHVWPMQVLAVGGRPVGPVTWQDVVNLPAGGEVTVRIAFEDFPGRTVYHCHILDHEDQGMMAVVQAHA